MRISIYGASGMVGSAITREAIRRGHDVLAVTRNGTAVEDSTPVAADISDISAFKRIAGRSDVVVFSVPPPRDGGDHDALVKAHGSILKTGPTARLFVVGGAGALRAGDRLLKDDPQFPAAFKPEAETMAKVFELYSSAKEPNWTMLAPAPIIVPGERTSLYRIGTDEPVGDSVSTEDFAIAALDEIERPQQIRRRFTVAN